VKLFIEKQTKKYGENWSNGEEVVAEVRQYENELLIEIDDNLRYSIPLDIIKLIQARDNDS